MKESILEKDKKCEHRMCDLRGREIRATEKCGKGERDNNESKIGRENEEKNKLRERRVIKNQEVGGGNTEKSLV